MSGFLSLGVRCRVKLSLSAPPKVNASERVKQHERLQPSNLAAVNTSHGYSLKTQAS